MKDSKAFTLIELLVVIAIIGVLAAVGIVSFGGFGDAAKKNVAKTNHTNAVKFIRTTIANCVINGTANLKYKANDSASYLINCSKTAVPNTDTLSLYILNHLVNDGVKNPYNSSQPAYTGEIYSVGQTWFGVSGNMSGIVDFTIITRVDENSANDLTSKFKDER
jgi:prepilin-type N-terminal cleavage/methylation domain-containing protein